MIGVVQRNECNTVFSFIPYDSVPFEPGIFVISPIPEFSPSIYSMKILGKSSPNHGASILYLYANFSSAIWGYWFISLTICTILLIGMERLLTHRRKNKKKISMKDMKQFMKFWWDYFMLTMDMAPTVISKLVASTVLWTSIVIAVYYGIHMILMNTLSADLTSNLPDAWIRTLHDLLYDPQFENFKQTVMSQLSMLEVLSKSRNGTEERVLYERIIQKRNESVITIDAADHVQIGQVFLSLFAEMNNRTRALIEDKMYVESFLEHFICHMQPEDGKHVVKSGPILGAPEAMLLSHSTHPQVVKLFIYRSQTGVEFGMFKGSMMAKVGMTLDAVTGVTKNIAGYQCADLLRGLLMKSMEEEDWKPLPYRFFRTFFRICSIILFTTLPVLMIELETGKIISGSRIIRVLESFGF